MKRTKRTHKQTKMIQYPDHVENSNVRETPPRSLMGETPQWQTRFTGQKGRLNKNPQNQSSLYALLFESRLVNQNAYITSQK